MHILNHSIWCHCMRLLGLSLEETDLDIDIVLVHSIIFKMCHF